MKRLYALVVMFCLSIFLVVTANAATAGNKDDTAGNKDAAAVEKAATEVGTSDTAGTPQGLKNLNKVMTHKIERSKKMHLKIEEGPKAEGK